MLRDREKQLHFPILIDAEDPENADGWLGFPPGTLFRKVQAVEADEIKKRMTKTFRGGDDLNLFRGLDSLRAAEEDWDDGKLKAANQLVRPWILKIPGSIVTEPPEKKWARARWDYASLMSNALQRAQLVVWFREKDERLLSPAIYCADWKTATFVAAWMGGVRICPKCEKPFVPKKDNQGYCRPEHGAAYRTERCRNNKKAGRPAGRKPKPNQ